MAVTAQTTTNSLLPVLRELRWSQTQLAAALRREAIRQGVTLPTTQSLVTLISRWVNNHQQPNDFYRELLSGATGRPRAELFSDEGSIVVATGPVSGVFSAVQDPFGFERSSRPRHLGEATVRGTSAKPPSATSKRSPPPTDGCTTPRPPLT